MKNPPTPCFELPAYSHPSLGPHNNYHCPIQHCRLQQRPDYPFCLIVRLLPSLRCIQNIGRMSLSISGDIHKPRAELMLGFKFSSSVWCMSWRSSVEPEVRVCIVCRPEISQGHMVLIKFMVGKPPCSGWLQVCNPLKVALRWL